MLRLIFRTRTEISPTNRHIFRTPFATYRTSRTSLVAQAHRMGPWVGGKYLMPMKFIGRWKKAEKAEKPIV